MKKRILESAIERRAITLIKDRWPEVQHRKMNGYGFNSWPDRMFLFANGVTVFIEFKRPGGELTPGQEHHAETLRALGYTVLVCDSAEQAVVYCEAAISNAKAKKKR